MTYIVCLLMSSALANEVVTARAVSGVTRHQVQGSAALINVATFSYNSQRYGVRCAGEGNTLRCEIVEKASSQVVTASDSLRICKRNNRVAVMSEDRGLSGRVIVLPDILNAAGRQQCGG